MTRDELIAEIASRLDERLVVEDPQPYGADIFVGRKDDQVIVAQPHGGPHFAISVTEVAP